MKINPIHQRHRTGSVLSLILLAVALTLGGVFFYNRIQNPCGIPITYSIGTIDERFAVKKDVVRKLAQSAERIWEDATGTELFIYDEASPFAINLVFDERQQTTSKEREMRADLDQKDATYASLASDFKRTKQQYEQMVKRYEASSEAYQKQVEEYNKTVAYYNARGGAAEPTIEMLERKRQDLEVFQKDLDTKLKELEEMERTLETKRKRVNEFARAFNREVSVYNSTFGTGRIFDQGEYIGDSINIYQFDNQDDLRLVIAHEFGHALTLDHVEGESSIMYPLVGKQDFKNPKPSSEDIAALKEKCNL